MTILSIPILKRTKRAYQKLLSNSQTEKELLVYQHKTPKFANQELLPAIDFFDKEIESCKAMITAIDFELSKA